MLLMGSMEQNLQRNLHWGALFQQAAEATFGWSENFKKKTKKNKLFHLVGPVKGLSVIFQLKLAGV